MKAIRKENEIKEEKAGKEEKRGVLHCISKSE